MPQTHSSGAIKGSRALGALITAHSFSVNLVDFPTSALAKKLLILAWDDPGILSPVALRLTAVILTAFDGTTNVLGVQLRGDVSPIDILTTVDLKAVTGTNYATTPPILLTKSSSQELWATRTHTGTPTVGNAYIIAELFHLTNTPSD